MQSLIVYFHVQLVKNFNNDTFLIYIYYLFFSSYLSFFKFYLINIMIIYLLINKKEIL